jgi:hypothetical protein
MGDLQVHRLGSSEFGTFAKKLLEDLRALEKMLDAGQIETGRRRIGCEQEMFLIDKAWRRRRGSGHALAPRNAARLDG